ncbi:MAG: hypothetical protein SPL16_04940 [Eubacteriales bacterium]|nr:hypothetical protein [Clostridiales bacterium]MDD6013049.1 hypothetical protein [Clostridiales bacterium]MDD7493467.1 hypothetical protein [Clostridiales bacterium]MDY5710057.1 hypothetical protein [Eubacteriales bacterium]
MTKGYDSDKDILKILDQATAEAKALHKDAQNGISKKIAESAMDMAAKYQLIMDTAEQEITDEYRSSGTLTSARVCDINRGMDDYVLSVQAVMALMEKAKAEGGK